MSNKATQFKTGFDSKRFVPVNNGLVEFHTELASLLRKQSLEAVDLLVDTMRDPKASTKLRVVCATQILDRGLGKPVDRSVVATMDAGTAVNIESLSTEELEQMLSKMDDKALIIDAECKDIN